jgi:hypothetical protein
MNARTHMDPYAAGVADFDPQERLQERMQDTAFYQDILNGHNCLSGEDGDIGEIARLLSWLGRDYLMAKDRKARDLAHSAMAARIETFFRSYIEPRVEEA